MSNLFKYLEGFCEGVKESEELERVCEKIYEKHGADVLRRHLAAAMRKLEIDEVSKHFNIGPVHTFRRVPKTVKPFMVKAEDGEPLYLKDSDYGFDHLKLLKAKHTNREILVSEPYNVSMEQLKNLIKTAERNNLNVTLPGGSMHFPGWTTGIWITKRHSKGGREDELAERRDR